jgi:methylase of polypeptide subunit release factors
MSEACELAIDNVKLNHVEERVTVLCGDLFEPVKRMKFDVIVDDVSGVAEEVARISSWFPPEVPLGGPDGADLTIAMLEQSQEHLNDGGHLFFPVLSLSNSAKIVSTARKIYGDRLKRVASKLVPFNHELKDHFDALVRLRDLGLIGFKEIRSRRFWSLEIYRADMPE